MSLAACSLQDGEVDAEELQRCLTQSGFTGSYSREFSATCLSTHCTSSQKRMYIKKKSRPPNDVRVYIEVQTDMIERALTRVFYCSIQPGDVQNHDCDAGCILVMSAEPLLVSTVSLPLWLLSLNWSPRREITPARWASTSSRSCSLPSTAGSRTS